MNQSDQKTASVKSAATVVTVRAGTRLFALPATQAKAIHPLGVVAPVPGAPPGITGLTNVDGRISVVVDFHARLGIAPAKEKPSNAVTVEHEGALYTFPVDVVEDVSASSKRQRSGMLVESLDLVSLIEGANHD